MTRSLRALAWVVVTMVAATFPAIASADAAPVPTSNGARVCRLLPLPQIEQLLGKSPSGIVGTDNDAMSICTANFPPDASAKVSYAKPGAPGLPADTHAMLAIPRQMQAEGQTVFMKEYGDVACYATHLQITHHDTWTTSCGLPSGYLLLAVARSGSMVPLDTVRKLLALAQQRL
jgi:hypothetical protein